MILTFVIIVLLRIIFSHLKTNSSVYLINLESRKDRLTKFNTNYKKSNLPPYNLINAIDGKNIILDNIDITQEAKKQIKLSHDYRQKHFELTQGAVGCYLSHYKCWQTAFINKDLDHVIIFEDDALVPKNGKEIIDEAMFNPPNDWDIILLGGLCIKCSLKKKNRYRKVYRFFLLHAYIINKKGFEKIKKNIFPIKQQLDSHLSHLCNESKLNVYTYENRYNKKIIQYASKTDIQTPIAPMANNPFESANE